MCIYFIHHQRQQSSFLLPDPSIFSKDNNGMPPNQRCLISGQNATRLNVRMDACICMYAHTCVCLR